MISVIIPARNGAAHIQKCLNATLHQQGLETDYEVIVVDDGSEDDTAALVQAMGVKLISIPATGPGTARNTGANVARGDLLAFTDADCVPSPDWLLNLTRPFDNADIVGAKGTYRTRQRSLVARFVQQEYESKYRRMGRTPYIDFIDTYSAAYRRDVFLKNGGFEPGFFFLEDQEFSFRLARKGYRMVFVPQAVVYHSHNETLKDYFMRKYGIGYWKAFMLRSLPEKTFSDSHTLSSQRWQILILGLAGILFTLGFTWKLAWVLFGLALVSFYLTGMPFLVQIMRRDPQVLPIAFLLLLLRALAQMLGLTAGFLFPPPLQRRDAIGLNIVPRFLKRIFDLIGGFLGLLISSPIILLAAIVIKLEDQGPVFYTQERAGENGKPFRLIKLRTMAVGADRRVPEMLKDNPLHGPVFKFPNDPRITRIGKFLRRWSLDELPQFWNVLIGEMSLVGPRPEETWMVSRYNDKQRQRLAVKPGLTGPMQVSGRGGLDMEGRMGLELDYIKHYSLLRDIQYLLKTIPAVIKGRGAF